MQASLFDRIARAFDPQFGSTISHETITDLTHAALTQTLERTPHMIIIDMVTPEQLHAQFATALRLVTRTKVDAILIGTTRQYVVTRSTTIDDLTSAFADELTALQTDIQANNQTNDINTTRKKTTQMLNDLEQRVRQSTTSMIPTHYALTGATITTGRRSITITNHHATRSDLFHTAARIARDHPTLSVIVHHEEFCVDASDFVPADHAYVSTHEIIAGLEGAMQMHEFAQQRELHKEKHEWR